MRKVTRQYLANTIADRWFRRYGNYIAKGWMSDEKARIHEKLVDLGSRPNPDDVDRVIGNGTWTFQRCGHCGEQQTEAVLFDGMASDEYGSSALCEACATLISELFKREQKPISGETLCALDEMEKHIKIARAELDLGKYTSWAKDLTADALTGLLWLIGEFSVRTYRDEFSLDGVRGAARRKVAALRAIADFGRKPQGREAVRALMLEALRGEQ